MSPPRDNEPSLVQVLYDSLNEIKAAVSGVSEKQTAAAVQLATILAQNGENERERKKLSERVEELENNVSVLKRTAWILTIVGGMVVAVVTSVTSDWVTDRVNSKPTSPITTLQTKE